MIEDPVRSLIDPVIFQKFLQWLLETALPTYIHTDHGLMHVTVMIKQHQGIWFTDLLYKKLCHIMIVPVVQEMDPAGTIWSQAFSDLLFCFFGAVHISPADITQIDPFQSCHLLFLKSQDFIHRH